MSVYRSVNIPNILPTYYLSAMNLIFPTDNQQNNKQQSVCRYKSKNLTLYNSSMKISLTNRITDEVFIFIGGSIGRMDKYLLMLSINNLTLNHIIPKIYFE